MNTADVFLFQDLYSLLYKPYFLHMRLDNAAILKIVEKRNWCKRSLSDITQSRPL
jgi:hypothetical protein